MGIASRTAQPGTAHLAEQCTDESCPRLPCRMYRDGYRRGYDRGYAKGLPRRRGGRILSWILSRIPLQALQQQAAGDPC
jgi:hypothetical protein